LPGSEEKEAMRVSGCFSNSLIGRVGNQYRGARKTVGRIHGLGRLLRRSRAEEGAALVEFALTFIVFIFLVFAVIDFGHLFFVKMDVQNAIQEAARYGSTGNHLPNPSNPTQTLSRVTSIIDTLQQDAIGVQFSSIQVSNCTPDGSTCSGSGSAGAPGNYLTVSATVNMPLFTPMIAQMFPNGQYTFNASVTVMNEPFPPGQTN
jgi:Flp pilus assembly protein TadG